MTEMDNKWAPLEQSSESREKIWSKTAPSPETFGFVSAASPRPSRAW